jgi:hypothetical protein
MAPWPRELGLLEDTVGLALTVKALASDPTPASGFVTVTVRTPVAAPDSTVILAVSSVELTKLVDSTVIPVPKDAVAPEAKLLPLTVIVCLLAPWPRELGVVDSMVGPALTVKPLSSDAESPSGFVMLTVRPPVVALDATVMFAFSSVELTNVVELSVTPVPENDTVAPLTKFVPITLTFWFAAPWPREPGLVDVIDGAATTTALLATLRAVHERHTAVTL